MPVIISQYKEGEKHVMDLTIVAIIANWATLFFAHYT